MHTTLPQRLCTLSPPAQFDGGNVLSEVTAHSSPLEALAWSHDASMLASASSKGTVIRVHRMPQVRGYERGEGSNGRSPWPHGATGEVV